MISPYLEKPLRTLEQALLERAAMQNAPADSAERMPAMRSASDAGSAQAAALLQRDRPAAEVQEVQEAQEAEKIQRAA